MTNNDAEKTEPVLEVVRYEVRITNLTFITESVLTPRELKLEVMDKLRTIGKVATPIGVSIR